MMKRRGQDKHPKTGKPIDMFGGEKAASTPKEPDYRQSEERRPKQAK